MSISAATRSANRGRQRSSRMSPRMDPIPKPAVMIAQSVAPPSSSFTSTGTEHEDGRQDDRRDSSPCRRGTRGPTSGCAPLTIRRAGCGGSASVAASGALVAESLADRSRPQRHEADDRHGEGRGVEQHGAAGTEARHEPGGQDRPGDGAGGIAQPAQGICRLQVRRCDRAGQQTGEGGREEGVRGAIDGGEHDEVGDAGIVR